jgi:hypothetical protein
VIINSDGSDERRLNLMSPGAEFLPPWALGSLRAKMIRELGRSGNQSERTRLRLLGDHARSRATGDAVTPLTLRINVKAAEA